jgi:hypothetical protein
MQKQILLLIFCFSAITNLAAQTSARKIMEEMFAACDRMQTLQFTMKRMERIDGKIDASTTLTKYRRAPFAVYLCNLTPHNGMEVLFNKGQNSEKAIINPNGFPYVNVSLSPYGNKMREGNHYTLYDVGFETLVSNLRHSVVILGSRTDDFFKNEGVVVFDGHQCDKIVLRNSSFAWQNYTVAKATSLESLARSLYLGSHMIKEKNKLADYGTLTAGTIIKIPTAFAKEVTLYIDKVTRAPIYQEIRDDAGVYAKYEFTNLIINPKFAADEFATTHTGYHF